jgi:hypothetical protein
VRLVPGALPQRSGAAAPWPRTVQIFAALPSVDAKRKLSWQLVPAPRLFSQPPCLICNRARLISCPGGHINATSASSKVCVVHDTAA